MFVLSGQAGEIFQPAAVVQAQSGLGGARRRAGRLPSPRPLVPHRQPEEGGHAGGEGNMQIARPQHHCEKVIVSVAWLK